MCAVDFIGGFDSYGYQGPQKTSHLQLQPMYMWVNPYSLVVYKPVWKASGNENNRKPSSVVLRVDANFLITTLKKNNLGADSTPWPQQVRVTRCAALKRFLQPAWGDDLASKHPRSQSNQASAGEANRIRGRPAPKLSREPKGTIKLMMFPHDILEVLFLCPHGWCLGKQD